MTRGIWVIFVKYTLWIYDLSVTLQVHWKSNEICTESESGSLAGCNTDRGRNSVQDGKHDGGQNGQGGNLIQRESLLRDEDRSGGDDQTLDQILNDAINNLSKSVAQHDSFIFTRKKKTCRRTGIVISQSIRV